MKKLMILLFFNVTNFTIIFAQKNDIDSIKKESKIEKIKKNVEIFFLQQNKRFSSNLESLNEEYVIYFTPAYKDRGALMYDLYKLDDQLKMQYDFEKQSCFDSNKINIPKQVIEYSNFLINKTNGHWCENKFGYDNLKYGDDFGILLIYSPKSIPDSLSILKLKEFTTSRYEYQTNKKKRMVDLALMQSHYINMADGLNERFIRVVLKY